VQPVSVRFRALPKEDALHATPNYQMTTLRLTAGHRLAIRHVTAHNKFSPPEFHHREATITLAMQLKAIFSSFINRRMPVEPDHHQRTGPVC
jgi:hypothetical protein